mmetsp:Transcript_30468/g.84039  ORF Transcript_30468/g.84039 Transcript_30468/m.84039 type:complete len:252 (-) Transcript_30468:13-768(-)
MAVPSLCVDTATAETFFSRQFEDPANRTCCDGGAAAPEWTSVSHGIYISIGSAGVHRSLGVGVSFVQSTSMDSWKPVHLKMMELGGNRRFAEFLRQHGVPEDLPIRQKYSTRAAQWYRENLRAMAEGTSPPPPLAPGEGCLPADDAFGRTDAVLDEVFAHVSDDDGSSGSGVVRRHGRATGRPIAGIADEEQGSSSCYKKACKNLKGAFTVAKMLVVAATANPDPAVSSLTPGRRATAVAGMVGGLAALAA